MHVFLHLLQEIDIVLSQHTAAQVQLLPPHGCAAREPHRSQQYSLVLGDRLEFQDIFDYSQLIEEFLYLKSTMTF